MAQIGREVVDWRRVTILVTFGPLARWFPAEPGLVKAVARGLRHRAEPAGICIHLDRIPLAPATKRPYRHDVLFCPVGESITEGPYCRIVKLGTKVGFMAGQ